MASVPALPQCHTQGDTIEEAEQNIKEAITLCLESLTAHGEPIPHGFGVSGTAHSIPPRPKPATARWRWADWWTSSAHAVAAGCDFEGLGPHSFRRINITWRQEAGASAIEAAQIAGHSTVRQTYDYTRTQLKHQEVTALAI